MKREVASMPARSARETWDTIVKLISGPGSIDCDQLNAGASIMASAIADEHSAQSPIVVKGVGSRLVIYTVHGADAMELGLGVDSLNWNPTAGDGWRITVPCDSEDVGWMNSALNARAWRISVHDFAESPSEDQDEETGGASDVVINWGALEK